MPDLHCNYPDPSSDSGPPKRFYILFDASLSASQKLHLIERELGFIFSRCAAETKVTVIRFSEERQTVLLDCPKKDIDCLKLWNTLQAADESDSKNIFLYDNIAETIQSIPSKEFKHYRIVIDVLTTGFDSGSKGYTLKKLVKVIQKKIIGKSKRHFHLYQEVASSELSASLRPMTIPYFKNCQIHYFVEPTQNGLATAVSDSDDELVEEKQGLVLIINNHFITLPERFTSPEDKEYYKSHFRQGAHIDTILMKEKFEELSGNEVTVAENVGCEDLCKHLNEFKQKIGAKDPDYIVLIVSTHGTSSNRLIMEDCQSIDMFNDLVYEFDSKNLPGFQNPKIFLIQACQTEDDESSSREGRDAYTHDGAPASTFLNRNNTPSVRLPQYQCSKSQFFIGQSTVPNEPAYRDTSNGSFYIQAISKCFRKGVKLENLLQEVYAEVSQACGIEGFEQSSSIWKLPDFPDNFCF